VDGRDGAISERNEAAKNVGVVIPQPLPIAGINAIELRRHDQRPASTPSAIGLLEYGV